MTTNKKKTGSRYYENSNVKNKNKKKQKDDVYRPQSKKNSKSKK